MANFITVTPAHPSAGCSMCPETADVEAITFPYPTAGGVEVRLCRHHRHELSVMLRLSAIKLDLRAANAMPPAELALDALFGFPVVIDPSMPPGTLSLRGYAA